MQFKMNDIVSADMCEIFSNLKDKIRAFEGRVVLITGGAGFLGYNFIHFLIYGNAKIFRLSCRIIVLDNFIRGLPSWLKEMEAGGLIKLIKADITKFDYKCLEDKPDFIIHAASIASPIFYRKYPIETMDANVIGLRAILDYSLDRIKEGSSLKSVLFFSSSEIYGDPQKDFIPTPEDYRGYVSCTGPRACYDESKRYGETLCVNFSKTYGVPVKIVRPFNNYGPGLNLEDRRVIPDFCRNVLNGENIVLLSDGRPSRTFCYITDAITGYLLLLLSDQNGEPFNIGTDYQEISMAELAKLIVKISRNAFGTKALEVIYEQSDDKNYLIDNPQRRCPLIKKARQVLNYQPAIELQEGLKRTLLWYKSQKQGE